MPQFVEIKDVEPKVVELGIVSDRPIISVRMPIYKMVETHDEFFFELKYKIQQNQFTCAFNLSPKLIELLHSSQKALDALPPMSDDHIPHTPTLGIIDHVLIAVTKLKKFDEEGKWKPYFPDIEVIGK